MKRFNIFSILLAIITVFMLDSCAVNPVTGKKEIMLMSEQKELALGKQSDPSVIAYFGSYEDPKMQGFINEKGKQMAAISHRSHLDFKFRVLDSPVVNAFAVPGGYVYFTRGIMAHFNNEAEFAGVLGHEIGHVTARHGARQQTGQILGQVGFIGGMVLSEGVRQNAQAIQQSLGMMFMSFSRAHESESDKLGVEYSTKINYDAKHMANFFNTLKRMQVNSGSTVPTFMSTHPDPADRFRKVNQMAAQRQQNMDVSKLQVNRNKYLRMIDGLIYGEDPQQGFVEKNTFYHPGLKFKFPIPVGWQTVNSPQQLQIFPKDQKAVMIFTLAQEKTLQEAANAISKMDSVQILESQNITLNGFPAAALVAQQGKGVKFLSYLIKDGTLIYKFFGVAGTVDFQSRLPYFLNTMKNFRRLTDQRIINIKPDRVRIKTVPRNSTLSQAFQYFKMPREKFEELSLINGMRLNDQVEKGMLIKVVSK